ncbi:MAG: pentapeptide repeat-containing protein [Planctomycetota bacterium]|jgi:hypothetical protein
MEKEDKQEPGRKQPEGERKFSQQQYDLLKRCSDEKDMTRWNEWRQEHPDEEIRLQGAKLRKTHLEKANLRQALLENADLMQAHLESAKLRNTHLENAYLGGTNLENAELREANLRGARFFDAKLQGADFSRAIVDSGTLFTENCEVDRDTKFEAVALGNLRIYPNIKQLLEYNIRRKNWEAGYKKQTKKKWLVKPFWLMSDYGLSTWRIIAVFFGLAFIFAIIYYLWALIAPPGLVSNMLVDESGMSLPWWLVPVRTLYFSIVTMTTLGFGDMYANARSISGHILLSLQVIFGYVLLGALVTRFAVIFSAGGPAGKFSKIEETEDL